MAPAFRRGRRRGLIAGAAIGTALAGRKAAKDQKPEAAEQSQTETAPNDSYEAQLTELSGLKDKGLITDKEFDAKRKRILGI